ncbi:MAG: ribosome biogenesis protein [Cenarchaeum symbiont of Oopsacas minuta]|nr:ribosome biogenesis protein [Cenarchaeum symbiont of Oopsacas minuta]
MLSLIIAESSLERVPAKITGHPSVTSMAKRFGKYPGRMLLDKSWHFGAMSYMDEKERRGRPDIVHLCMLMACGTPLYMKDLLHVYVHTAEDKVIEVGKRVRMPKSYHRFVGLMEDLYLDGRIKDDSGHMLVEIFDSDLTTLLERIEPDILTGLSTIGYPSTYGRVASRFDGCSDGCIVIGGFPKGHFSDKTVSNLDEMYSVPGGSQDAHVILSRILYEYEATALE